MIGFVFASLLAASTLAAAPSLTIDDYVSMPGINGVRFSPDGARIAYVVTRPNFARATYDGEIHIIRADGSDEMTLTRSSGTDYAPRWSPDGKRIAFLSDRSGKIAVHVINVGGGEASQVTDEPTAVSRFDWTPDGKTILFLRSDETSAEEKRRAKEKDDARVVGQDTRHSRLYAVDIESRTVRRLTDGSYSVAAFSISPDGRTIAFDRSSSTGLDADYHTDIYTIATTGGEPRPFVVREGMDANPRFSPDGKSIAFISEGGIHDWLREDQLYVVPLAGGTPRTVTNGYGRSLFGFSWSDDSRSLLFNGPLGTTSQMFRADAGGDGITNISKLDGVVESIDVDTTRDRAAFVYQTLTAPPELYVSSITKFAPRRLTSINAAYRDRATGETRLIRWKNPKDGLEIEGLLTLPVGYTPGKKVPLLTFIHGGPASRFDQSFLGYLSYIYPTHVFAAEGFAVLRPNPRGTGGYGESFRAANRNDWAGMDWIDINAGIDRLISDGIADPDRLGLMGWSYGGYIAAWAAGHSDRFKAISIGAPVVDLLSFHGTTDIRQFIPNYFNAKPMSLELLRERSPLWHLRPTKTPILIQHGEADERVPLSQGTMLYRMFDELGANVTMVTYPRSGHTPREPKLRLDVARRNVEFMKKWVR